MYINEYNNKQITLGNSEKCHHNFSEPKVT